MLLWRFSRQYSRTLLIPLFQVHRLNAIKDAEKIESLKAAKRMEGARQIMDQIKSNTEVRILEEEKKNAER